MRAESLAPLRFSRPGMGLSILEGCFAMAPQTFNAGVFLTGFALMLGVDSWALGLLAAVPAICQAAQLTTPMLMQRGVCRKQLVIWGASLGRYLWLPIALTPFLPLAASAKLGLFLALLAIATMLSQASGVGWNDWMSEVVPDAERGRYFGLRNALTGMVGLVMLWCGSRWLDAVKASGHEALGFSVLLGLGLLGAIGSQVALTNQPHPMRFALKRDRRSALAAPLGNAAFLRLLALYFVWMAVTGLLGPFSYAYALQTLHVSYATIGMHASIVAALGTVSQPFWGRMIDKRGPQATIALAMVPICIHPLYWTVMHPGFTWLLWCDAVSNGVFWAGVNLAILTMLMEIAPRGERAAYMGLWNCGMGIATSGAALIGGRLLMEQGHWSLAVGPRAIGMWTLLLIVGFVGRVVCLALFASLPRVQAPTLTIDTWAADPAASPAPIGDVPAGA
ncbi:MAG TPA: MFS transporter [Oscillatoriaceae cyanobacterium]